MRTYLLGKKTPPQVADQLLDRFEDVGLINDELYARAWAQSRHDNRQLSSAMLKRELRAKGIADQLIDQAVAQIGPEQEHQAALDFARCKARGLRGVDQQVAFRRLSGALARRGYAAGVVVPVVKQVLAELSATQQPGINPDSPVEEDS